MYSFDGDFRPGKPKVSISGRSHNSSHSDVIKAAQEARLQRERDRKRVESATLIQAAFRGYRARAACRKDYLTNFDRNLTDLSKHFSGGRQNDLTGEEEAALVRKTRRFLAGACFYAKPSEDGATLTKLLSLCLSQTKFLIPRAVDGRLEHCLKCVLVVAGKLLRNLAAKSTAAPTTANSHAPPLRVLQTFFDASTYVSNGSSTITTAKVHCLVQRLVLFCVRRGFFSDLLAFFDDRVPVDAQLAAHSTPRLTPLAESLLTLLSIPLTLSASDEGGGFEGKAGDFDGCSSGGKTGFSDDVFLNLMQSAFESGISPQTSFLLLPYLVNIKLSMSKLLPLVRRSLPPRGEQMSKVMTSSSASKTPKNGAVKALLKPTPWMLLALVTLAQKLLDSATDIAVIVDYFEVLEILFMNLPLPESIMNDYDEDDDDAMEFIEGSIDGNLATNESEAVHISCRYLQSRVHSKIFRRAADLSSIERRLISPLCVVSYHLLRRDARNSSTKTTTTTTDLISRLAYAPNFLRALWDHLLALDTLVIGDKRCSLIALIVRGVDISIANLHRVAPPLTLFCACFVNLLFAIHDNEFLVKGVLAGKSSSSSAAAGRKRSRDDFLDGDEEAWNPMPFNESEVVALCAMLRDLGVGIIRLAHPDSWTQINEDYQHILDKSRLSWMEEMKMAKSEFQSTLVFAFKHLVVLIKHLHSRDSRNNFTPDNHWIADVDINADKLNQIYKAHQVVFEMRTFTSSSFLDAQQMNQEEGLFLSNTDVKNLTILRELPFVVNFHERVKILQRIIMQDKKDHQGEVFLGDTDGVITINVRRGFLYEDAFEKLSPENEQNMKLRMRVQMQNAVGLDEAGIDGGGIFREFLNELLKEAFNPTRGYFIMTHDKLLYPNPVAHLIDPDFHRHYFFLGRMLGKAIYENMLVELPFAGFFLSKIFGERGGDVDFHHLASLDPSIYKGLLYLKNYRGDVKEDLHLDFSLLVDEFGVMRKVDLKPNGKELQVDNSNRIEYIHLVADFYLNKRIRPQCKAFYKGLTDVVDLEWLRMFNYHEHQVIISGASHPVDIQDLKAHTNYSGGYDVGHPVVENFWTVASELDERRRRALLKFVTSCSRPPLLGFKDLYPAFCIHNGGKDETRLPTAATCMNLLKLPEYKDIESLRTKILYAIDSGAGFELS